MEQNNEIIYGKNPVTELLKSKAGVDTVFISEKLNPSVQNYYIALAKDCGAVVKKVHPMKLKSLCQSENHQGVAAMAAEKEYCEVADILKITEERGEDPFIVILDGVEDPYNLGAVVRCAECAGAHGVIIPKRRAAGLTPAAAKSSAGALEHMAVAKVVNISAAIEELQAAGVWVYAAEADGDELYGVDMNRAAAFVFGSEGRGVSRLVCEKSDYKVSIPMYGKVNSMNVSTAAAVVLTEAARQKHSGIN